MDKQIVILNMKSRFLLSVVFFGMIAGLSASPVYRMGSYNIRGGLAREQHQDVASIGGIVGRRLCDSFLGSDFRDERYAYDYRIQGREVYFAG